MLILLLFAIFLAIKSFMIPVWNFLVQTAEYLERVWSSVQIALFVGQSGIRALNKGAHVVLTPKWVPLRALPNLAVSRVLLLSHYPYLEHYLQQLSIYGMGLIFSRASDCKNFPTLINRQYQYLLSTLCCGYCFSLTSPGFGASVIFGNDSQPNRFILADKNRIFFHRTYR